MRVDDLNDNKLLEIYIGALKFDIQHELRLSCPTGIDQAIELALCIKAKNIASHKSFIGPTIGNEDKYIHNKAITSQAAKNSPK
jgi:hypothetical protein